jgi:hypothetical protein
LVTAGNGDEADSRRRRRSKENNRRDDNHMLLPFIFIAARINSAISIVATPLSLHVT